MLKEELSIHNTRVSGANWEWANTYFITRVDCCSSGSPPLISHQLNKQSVEHEPLSEAQLAEISIQVQRYLDGSLMGISVKPLRT